MSSADTETPAEAAPVTDEVREAVLAEFTSLLGDGVVGSHIRPGDDLWIRVDRSHWLETANIAKAMEYRFFDFLSAIDWLPSPFGRDMDSQEDRIVSGAQPKAPEVMVQGYAGGETRFQLLARLYSISAGMGITFKCDLPDGDLSAPTWSTVFAGANWHEREAREMFGLSFDGHPNMINMYLPADFVGHPLRKDFPLLARRVRPWPGIVDVEPMPGVADEEGEGE
ncbi:MAG: NADH-quinone oxidoreductase subunit C [Acidimicrobiales bacterium]